MSLRAAGVSKAAPYHHFASKDALLAGIATQGFNELTETMSKRMADETRPNARLNASGFGYVAFAVANPELFALMFDGVTQKSSGDVALGEAGLRRPAIGDQGRADRERTKCGGQGARRSMVVVCTDWRNS